MPDGPLVLTRESHRRAYAHDASHYLLYPREVWVASSRDDVVDALVSARERALPLTFRAGGTSLSGQGVSDGLMVDVRRGFSRIRILDDGARVCLEPGVTIRHVNAVLRRRGRALGPDPASEIAATVGGVVANNSSGMACGITDNAYQSIDSMVFVLPSGTVVDSASPTADRDLAKKEPAIHAMLGDVRDRLRADADAAEVVRARFAMKNTMGYSLNSFLDFERPVDILTHLLVGSEGTLAFIAEVTMRTVPILPSRAAGLVVFPSLDAATRAIPAISTAGVHAAELMDARSLRVAQSFPDAPPEIADLNIADHCALLVECRGVDEEALQASTAAAAAALRQHGTEAVFSRDEATCAALWNVRKGLYAACAGARPAGTSALLEDIVVPVQALADTCRGLAALFDAHGYADAVIFGHAKDGNLHFLISDAFAAPEANERLARFTEDMVDLILKNGGNLKAEHGTGRAMAPFVARQYGETLYAMLQEIKAAVDPGGVLNPGVILPTAADAHLTDFKEPVGVHEVVDSCVECGYCEPTCPSKNLTLTPRTRIALLREQRMAQQRGEHALARELAEDYRYEGVETCAVDGMCQTACPLGINTGDLVRDLRGGQSRPVQAVWEGAARGWQAFTGVGAMALTAANRLPASVVRALTTAARSALGAEHVPQYSQDVPAGGKRRRRDGTVSYDAVYFPSCLNALFGSGRRTSLQEDFEYLCGRAGTPVHVPAGIDGLCCGTPWSSKGMADGHARMRDRVVPALRAASRNGAVPIVCDASSCTEGLIKMLSDLGLEVIDAPQFLADRVLAQLPMPAAVLDSLTVHPTCSATRIGSVDAVLAVAKTVAEDVRVPDSWGCCAFAGDRGLLHPELTASATRQEADEVTTLNSSAHASSNMTCEMGMSRATGENYLGVVQLLADAVRASAP